MREVAGETRGSRHRTEWQPPPSRYGHLFGRWPEPAAPSRKFRHQKLALASFDSRWSGQVRGNLRILSRLALMNSYVERTRPALSFVGIGIALLNQEDASLLSTKSWELHFTPHRGQVHN